MRQCLVGLQEKIDGLSFSPCVKSLVSASQDLAVPVWDIKNHCLTVTLKGHGTDHEFLRLVWAGVGWFGKGGRRGGGGE